MADDPSQYDESKIDRSEDICTNGQLHEIDLHPAGTPPGHLGVHKICRNCRKDLINWVHPKFR